MAKSKIDKYLTPEGLQKLKSWSESGSTYEQIAKKIGISEATIYNWMKKYPAIKEALMEGDGEKEKIAIGSLFKLMQGYKDTEVKVERYKLNGKVIENDPKFPIKEVITTKVIPPNMGAIAFFLKCRRGWTEKAVVEMQAQNINPLSGLTTEELKKLAKDDD